MQVERTYSIRAKILTATSLALLLDLAKSHFDKLSTKSKHVRLELTFESAGGSKYSFDTPDEAISSNIPQTKRILKISIHISDYQPSRDISLRLSHGQAGYGNALTISSNDDAWTMGTFEDFTSLIESFPPQRQFTKRFMFMISIAVSLLLARLLYTFTAFMTYAVNTTAFDAWFGAGPGVWVTLFAAYVLWFPVDNAVEKYTDLWPTVELQLGPEHTHYEKKRRLALKSFFVAVILPILTSVLYEFLRSKFLK